MAKGGRKYRLILYQHILDRWWPATLTLAIIIFLNVGALWGAQWYFIEPSENPLPVLSDNGGYIMLAAGGFALFFTFFLLFMRRGAYVQLFDTYLRLATPFLRINISYKRIHKTTTVQVATLFPPNKYGGWKRDIIEPIAGDTAIVMHLTAYPLPRATFALFLSSFFFFDKTPHFVLVVDDWMNFSVELDSRRMGTKLPRQPARQRSAASSLLDDLRRK
jgi:hypothetical protein